MLGYRLYVLRSTQCDDCFISMIVCSNRDSFKKYFVATISVPSQAQLVTMAVPRSAVALKGWVTFKDDLRIVPIQLQSQQRPILGPMLLL